MFQRQILFSQNSNAFYHVPSIVIAFDGSVLAFCEARWRLPGDETGECHIVMKKSRDHGKSWGDLIQLRRRQGAKFHMGSAAVDTHTGRVLLMCGGGNLQSADNGDTWQDWQPAVHETQNRSQHDGGFHFIEKAPGARLRELSQGCNASMIRYPPERCGRRDVLLFANPDTADPTGNMA